MLKYYITPIFLFITIQALNAKGIYYQDRVLFYVDIIQETLNRSNLGNLD